MPASAKGSLLKHSVFPCDFTYQAEGELRRLYLGKFYIESDRWESLSDRLKLSKFYSLTVKI